MICLLFLREKDNLLFYKTKQQQQQKGDMLIIKNSPGQLGLHREILSQRKKKLKLWARGMAQQAKTLATKPESDSWDPDSGSRTPMS